MNINPKDRINTIQAAVIVSNFILGSGILTLSRATAEKAGTPDVWISVLIGGLIAIAAGVVMATLNKSYPEQTVYQYNRIIVGRWFGGFIGLLFVCYFCMTAAYQVRTLTEVTGLFLLEGTPPWASVMVFMWVSLYLMVGGINPIARLFELILPVTIIIYLLVTLMGLRILDPNNLRPVLGQGIMPVLAGLKATVFSFTGLEVILILTAFMKHPNKSVKAVVYGIVMPMGIYLITAVMAIGVLSVDGVVTRTWPTLDLVRSFELTGLIFERFESLLLVIWIMQIYSTFTIAIYAASLGLSQLFNVKIQKCMYALLPIVFIIWAIPKNINELSAFGDFIGNISLYLFGIVPIVLLLLSKWKKGSTEETDEAES
ncbi:spore germination protein [Paenibacillus prosopidis]|uniref:Spore germination protein n=1 Tax=Paenibacillus prosopidis TaxID=630520 RepID=A0A368WBP1_9BACL|nr:spore germination protein [Paenibacillus prosopidis]RCW50827.1 spore germination protein [Paenibacillus prosopidis]